MYWLQLYIYENANNIPNKYENVKFFIANIYFICKLWMTLFDILCKYFKKNKLCEGKDIHSKHILCKYRMNGSAALIIDETAEKGSHWASE